MPNNPSLTPPPLIPISMLGAQNAKSKHQTNSSPPKLQRIPKSDGAETQTRNSSKTTKIPSSNSPSTIDKKESTWFPQTENEFLQSHDGTMPKPAQNIAVMGGKRYIVVPKNNAMAVQPAITVKPDKIGDKPPLLQDGSLTDITDNITDNSVANLCAPPSSNTDLSEKMNITADEEISKDIIHRTDLISSITTEMTETFMHDNKDKDNKNTPKEDESVENILETESFTANIDYVSERKIVDTSCRSPESKPENKRAPIPVHTASITNALEASAETEIIKTDRQQSLSSKVGEMKIKKSK